MAGYKGPLGKYINGDLSKDEFIKLLKSGAAKGKAKGGEAKPKTTLSLAEDGPGELSELDEFGYAYWVGDISDEEYAEFYDAMG